MAGMAAKSAKKPPPPPPSQWVREREKQSGPSTVRKIGKNNKNVI